MLIGVAAGLAAGALWGLTFVAPRAVAPYSEVDIAILRYMAFGLTSLLLMAVDRRFRPGPMNARRMLLALWLGLSGFVIYFLCIAFAVRLAGPAIAPLVIGGLPLVLALYGNWQDGSVSWKALAGPLVLIAVGLGIVNLASIRMAETAAAQADVVKGFLIALLGLGIWFLYAVTNARTMRSANPPPALGWTSLQGLGAAAGTLPLLALAPAMGWSRIPDLGFAGEAGMRLLLWALITGVLASWIAQYFWTLASHRLPLALSAQLIVAETLFALLYGFAWEGRWPHASEWAGGILLIAGVAWGVKVFAGGPAPARAAGDGTTARSVL
jgi:drug/metabolite transporter (DMT)-like permease